MPAWFKNRAECVQAEGAFGFKILGPDARQAVPALTELCGQYNSTNPLMVTASQMSVLEALIGIGPAATPSFLRWAASSNQSDRTCGVIGLWKVRNVPSVAVPVLAASLSDANGNIRVTAAAALGDYGSEARQAVPALELLLNDPSELVRSSTTAALRKIDPEAAAKAGVH
jgi:HEAT repeat protein